jgi:translation initiation factor 1A
MRKFKSRRKKKRRHPKAVGPGDEKFRVRLPRENELVGHVEQLHGARFMTVKCSDGKLRMCRVPGRMKKVWVRNNDYVLVEPWPVEGDKKGNIVWRYRQAEVDVLEKKGLLEGL